MLLNISCFLVNGPLFNHYYYLNCRYEVSFVSSLFIAICVFQYFQLLMGKLHLVTNTIKIFESILPAEPN